MQHTSSKLTYSGARLLGYVLIFLAACTSRQEDHDGSRLDQVRSYFDQGDTLVVFNEDLIGIDIEKGVITGNYIYLVDRSSMSVSYITMDGRLVNRIGGRGRGPGEFLDLSVIVNYRDGVLVLDRSLGRMTALLPVLENETHEEKISTPNALIFDVCEVDSTVWAYSLMEEGSLHQLSSDLDQALKSVGIGTDRVDILERARRRDAKIYCDASNIYIAYQFQNLIQVYSTNTGELTSEVRLSDIVPVELVLFDGANGTSIAHKYYPGKLPDTDLNFQDNLKNIFLVRQIVVAQYERTFKASERPSQVITWFVDMDSGSNNFTDELGFMVAVQDDLTLFRDTDGNFQVVQHKTKP